MGSEDHRVPALQYRKSVAGDRRGRVRHRGKGPDHADGLGYLEEAFLLVLFHDADGLQAAEIAKGPKGLLLVFSQLVLVDAHARLFNGQTSAGLGMLELVHFPAHRRHHLIHPFLRPEFDLLLCRAGSVHKIPDFIGHCLLLDRTELF